MSLVSFPISTTPLDGVPVLSSIPAGTNLLVIPSTGGVKQAPAMLINPTIYFSVTNYGATGNGTTDDTAAIAAAITAATTTGGTVYFKPGVYFTSSALTIPAGVSLIGDAATIKSSTPTQGNKLSIAASNVTIEGLTLDGAYTGTSGSLNMAYGLINITGASDFVPVQNVTIKNCTIKDSGAIGITVTGNVDGLRITGNNFASCFLSIFGHTTSTVTIFKNVFIHGNRFSKNWGSGNQSGAIKLQSNDDAYQLAPINLIVESNTIDFPGQMGVELWKFSTRSTVRGNIITGAETGVSIDRGSFINISQNQTYQCTEAGIELATLTNNCLVSDNVVSCYQASGSRGSVFGIVVSNTTCVRNTILGNAVFGCSSKGILMQQSDQSVVEGNTVNDCDVLIYSQNSNNLNIRANQLHGPCGYHVFLDAGSANATNIDIESNYFFGAASQDNIIYYDAGNGRTLANLRIHGNNAIGATFSNLSINKSIPLSRMTNVQCYDNYFNAGGSNADFTAFSAATAAPSPYSASLQHAGISVGAKTVLTIAPNAGSQWFKVLDADIGTAFLCWVHVYTEDIDNRKSAISAMLAGGAFGQDAHVTILPTGRFNQPIIEQVIYDNTGNGSHQCIWLRVAANTSGGTLNIYVSDYPSSVVTTPTAVTTEPTWAGNSYKASVVTSFLQAPRIMLKNGATVTDGVGDPTGVSFQPVGSLYLRADGGASTTLYVKESGTGASGWVAK